MYQKHKQLQPLENVTEGQSNNSKLKMAQEANNPRNDRTMTAEKSNEKLPSSTDTADNNFVSSDVDNCINNIRRSGKKNAQKNIASISLHCKRIINCRRLNC